MPAGGWNKGKPSHNRGKGRNYQWIVDHLEYRYDDCLKWPFGRDTHGYGTLGHLGKVRKAHRVMCEMIHGPAPSPVHEASHSFNRGHQGCINPNHISWKTRSDNQRDRTDSYGRGAPRNKLTEADVARIRGLFATMTNLAIAKQYDVTPSLISKIKNGHLRVPDRKRIFVPMTDDQVREIRKLYATTSARELAERYGVTRGKILHILKRNSHGYVA